MKFIVTSDSALDYFEKNPTISIIGKTLLRLYGGIFDLITPINLELIASKTGQHVSNIITILQKMEHDQMIELDLQDTDASITFLIPREDDKAINRISKEVATLNKKKEQDVASVLRYIDNNTLCRSIQLLNYFGEKVRSQCGICSVCTAQKTIPSKKESILISEQLLSMLEENNCTSREMVESLNFNESKILKVIHQLMDIEKIGINTKNQYYLN